MSTLSQCTPIAIHISLEYNVVCRVWFHSEWGRRIKEMEWSRVKEDMEVVKVNVDAVVKEDMVLVAWVVHNDNGGIRDARGRRISHA